VGIKYSLGSLQGNKHSKNAKDPVIP
jgi:hypothetical protein